MYLSDNNNKFKLKMEKDKILNIMIITELIIVVSCSIFSSIARNILFLSLITLLVGFLNFKFNKNLVNRKINKK